MPRAPSPLALLLALTACGRPDPEPASRATDPSPARPSPATTDLEELHAFARLYGYVRYFHPSDEAAALDWDAFAVHGVQQVTAARDQGELAQTLEALFAPVAPTLDVYREGEAPRELATLLPADATGLDVVAWQHLGYGFGTMSMAAGYHSGRTHRSPRESPQGLARSTTVSQALDATPLRGRRIRLRAFARVDPTAPAASVQPSIVIARAPGSSVRRSASRLVDTRWAPLEVQAEVPADATTLTLELTVVGHGAAWLDDVSLAREEAGAWSPVPLENPGFEADAAELHPWRRGSDDFEHGVDPAAHDGARALRVARKLVPDPTPALDLVPSPAEPLAASLGAGLHCRLPLALYSRDGHTLGPPGAAPPPPPPDLADVPRSPEHAAVRIAAVVVAWNVLQHFYPYFDDVGTDWEAVLDPALADALDDATPADHHRTLRWLVAQLHDGHGNVHSPVVADEAELPVRLGWVEGRVVVLAAPADGPLQRGDELVRIDGQDVLAKLEAEMALTSGSPHHQRYRALERGGLTRGPRGSRARVELRRGDRALTVEVERGDDEPPSSRLHAPIEQRPDGVWIIDVSRAHYSELVAKLDAIAAAPGVVFDVRDYPLGLSHLLVQHLLRDAHSLALVSAPRIALPDRQRIGWEWNDIFPLAPVAPRFTGRVAFIADAGTISYGESLLMYVRALGLGEIVGSPTAGANGNINPFIVPGGSMIFWTGLKVVDHEGGRHHGIGVPPTVPVEPTLAGVRAGRDELLERALEVVRG